MNSNYQLPVSSSEEKDLRFLFNLNPSANTMTTPDYDFADWASMLGVNPTMFASPIDPFNTPMMSESIYPDLRYDLDPHRTITPGLGLPMSPTENYAYASTPHDRRYDDQNPLCSASSAALNISYPTQKPPKSDSNITNANETDRPYSKSGTPCHTSTFQCHWKGCRYNGTFGRSTELKRHVETQHISPNAFSCPYRGCNKSYNREDNLKSHVRRAHPSEV
ncbi:hypothetical protein N7456_001095 [Penicillium angulare]|uniref:C2H2-type domain-containing protein n=1 Tax=Penicillium angulare TaxID=116970 RepID=A0A9W9KRJ5_9EURO|nr:hypothetical protein N7456_001095 [Penicillium angulare]